MLYSDPVSMNLPSPSGAASISSPRAKAAFQEFEHFFAYKLLREMRDSVGEGGLFDKSPAMDMYKDLMDDALAEKMAESGQLGVAKMMEEQLRIQDMQDDLHAQIAERRLDEARTQLMELKPKGSLADTDR